MWKRCSFVETALFCGNCTLLWERHSCRDWFNLKNRGRSAAPTGQFNRAAPTLQQLVQGLCWHLSAARLRLVFISLLFARAVAADIALQQQTNLLIVTALQQR